MTLEEMIAARNAKENKTVAPTQEVKTEPVQQAQATAQVEKIEQPTFVKGSEDLGSTQNHFEQPKEENSANIDISKFEGSVSSQKYVKPHLAEDIYKSVLKSIDIKTVKDFNTGESVNKYLWSFELREDSAGNAVTEDIHGKPFNKPVVLTLFTNIAWGVKSTNYKLYSKITGKAPNEGEKYNILECVGKNCRVNVETIEPKDKQNQPYSKINGVMAAKN